MKLPKTHVLAAFVLMLTPILSAADDAEWLVAPYVWLSDITLDQSSGVSGGISASDPRARALPCRRRSLDSACSLSWM
jgi:hypothetical protein